MRVLFDGKLLDAALLTDVETTVSSAKDQFDVVAKQGNDIIKVLGTFDTEVKAKNFVNTLGEKMMQAELGDVIDMR